MEVRVKASPKGIQMQIRYMSLCMSNNVKPTGCQIPLLTYRVTILSPLPPGLAVTRYSPQGTVLYNTIIWERVILCFLRLGAIISIDTFVPYSTSLTLWNLHPLNFIPDNRMQHWAAWFSVTEIAIPFCCMLLTCYLNSFVKRNCFAKDRRLGNIF